MERILHDLWLRLWVPGWLDYLPESLREPPQVWAVLLIVAAVVIGIGLTLLRALLRRLKGSLSTSRARRELAAEPKQLLKDGKFQAAGQAFEALGQTGKALKAYEQGGCTEEATALLLYLGKREAAKKKARDGGAWQLYAEICQDDGDTEEAAVAFERAGQAYLAGRSYAELGRPLDAARCYLAAGMEAEAVHQLSSSDEPEAAAILDRAIRHAVLQTGPSGLSLELQHAVERGVQLWLSQGRADKAFRLAVDAERFKLAVPVARDYLEPSVEAAAICARAGEHRVAAELYTRLGDSRAAALQQAEDALRRGASAEAAGYFESAEQWADAADQWAAAGQTAKAAELFDRAGDAVSAAQLRGTLPGAMDTPLGLPSAADGEGATLPGRTGVRPGDAPLPDETVLAGAPTRKPAHLIRQETEAAPEQRYRILEELGRGGMGVVYRAEDVVLQRQVAYKEVPEHVLGVLVEPESLLLEARAAARLSHPNIVQVFDAGRKGDGFYVVMELVQGRSLEEVVAQKQVTVAGTLRLGLQICAALDHAHSRRIIHRDLKPSNLMWSEEGVLKLADFGLARVFEAGKGRVATQPAGTPSYMAPEQIRGEELSPAVDIYSLGCVLFELLCRESVFGTGPPSFHHHLVSTPRDPRQLRPEVPEALATLILRCLSKSPADRPQSVAEIGRELKSILATLDA